MKDRRTAERVVDVRDISPSVRHEVIAQLFRNLPPGGGLEVVNDHDPKRLRFEFEARFGDRFVWTYLEDGPDRWRVRISRPARPEGERR